MNTDMDIPNENKTILIELDNTIYELNFGLEKEGLVISIQEKDSVVWEEFFAIYSLEALQKKSKYFKIFDSIQEAYPDIKEIFEKEKFTIEREETCIILVLEVQVQAIKEIILPIPLKKTDSETITQDLCTSVSNLNKKINELSQEMSYLKMDSRIYAIIERGKLSQLEKADTLLSDENERMIKFWIKENEEKLCKTLTLIYKGSINGDSSALFHSFCDDLTPTVVLVKTKKGFVFGGYTTQSWKHAGCYKTDSKSFIFSITKKKKFNISNTNYSIYCVESNGPTFGGGHDFKISNNFLSTGGSCNAGHSYQGSSSAFITGGEAVFAIDDVEVYKVNF